MPCSDGGQTEYELKRSKVLLCAACRVLVRYGYDFDENAELSTWWVEHQKEDQSAAEVLAKNYSAFKMSLDHISQSDWELIKMILKKYPNPDDVAGD